MTQSGHEGLKIVAVQLDPGTPFMLLPWSRIEVGIRPDALTMKSPFRARNDTAGPVVRERA
jgi:hypothetical protein